MESSSVCQIVKIRTKIKKLTLCQFFIENQVHLSQGPTQL
jgi:hypothetical protein